MPARCRSCHSNSWLSAPPGSLSGPKRSWSGPKRSWSGRSRFWTSTRGCWTQWRAEPCRPKANWLRPWLLGGGGMPSGSDALSAPPMPVPRRPCPVTAYPRVVAKSQAGQPPNPGAGKGLEPAMQLGMDLVRQARAAAKSARHRPTGTGRWPRPIGRAGALRGGSAPLPGPGLVVPAGTIAGGAGSAVLGVATVSAAGTGAPVETVLLGGLAAGSGLRRVALTPPGQGPRGTPASPPLAPAAPGPAASRGPRRRPG